MEVTAKMSSLLQMPQALTEIAPVDDSATGQPNTLQSMRFCMLLDRCTGTGEGVKNPTELFTPGLFSKGIADTAKTVQKSPEQNMPDSGLSDAGKEVKSTQDSATGEKFITESLIMQMDHDASPMIGKLLHGEESATNTLEELLAEGTGKIQTASEKRTGGQTFQKLPILSSEESNLLECILPEEPPESSKETAKTDQTRTPLFAEGNPFLQWIAAKQLTESQTKGDFKPSPVDGLQASGISMEQEVIESMPGLLSGHLRNNQKQADSQPEEATDNTTMLSAPGPIPVKENASDENRQSPSANQPNCLIQAAAGAAIGNLPDTSTAFASEVPDSSLSSGVQNQFSFLKAAAIYRTASPGSESAPGSSGNIAEISMKAGTNAAVPQTEGEIRTKRGIPIIQTQTTNSETASDVTTGIRKSFQSAELFPDTRENGKARVSVGNAYRSVAVEGLTRGNNGFPTVQDNVPQANLAANNDLIAANAGIDPRRIDIVFAETGGANRKETAGESLQESRETKTSGNATQIDFIPNSGNLRAHEESRISSTATDAKVPLYEQITNQIKEKLDANDHATNNGQITLKLHPKELGELKISMRMEDQHLKIEITTQNPSVKEALMQNLDTLKETLSRQNIAMDQFKVSEDLRQGFQQWSRDGRQALQDNRGANTGYQPAPTAEEDAIPELRYRWENEESLVNLTL
jgi:flagellar hook-length control protein FliK